MKRIDPTDGKLYSQEQFVNEYGSEKEWGEAERRSDPSDGIPRTKKDFARRYKSLDEWKEARESNEAVEVSKGGSGSKGSKGSKGEGERSKGGKGAKGENVKGGKGGGKEGKKKGTNTTTTAPTTSLPDELVSALKEASRRTSFYHVYGVRQAIEYELYEVMWWMLLTKANDINSPPRHAPLLRIKQTDFSKVSVGDLSGDAVREKFSIPAYDKHGAFRVYEAMTAGPTYVREDEVKEIVSRVINTVTGKTKGVAEVTKFLMKQKYFLGAIFFIVLDFSGEEAYTKLVYREADDDTHHVIANPRSLRGSHKTDELSMKLVCPKVRINEFRRMLRAVVEVNVITDNKTQKHVAGELYGKCDWFKPIESTSKGTLKAITK